MRPAVWAPRAARVDLDRGAGAPRVALSREPDGWWRGPAGLDLPHGSDYAFALDGGQPLPDPRSAWQPHGVHGPSRVFDTAGFAWTDAGWPGPRGGRDVRGAVVYELHVGTFTPEGTLDAAIGRLDHLARLGIDVVELMPVAAFDGERGWGYDGVALYAVHRAYGGPAALQRFVDAAHTRGIGVCLDVVYNHLGPSGNYLDRFGPYFTDTHQTPWGAAVNLDDEGAGEVRRWICDNALRWFASFHVDALRLDAVHALVDDSDRHLLAQLSDEVAALAGRLGRPLSLIAESDLNDAAMVTPTASGGLGMTAQWDDDVHHAVHALLTGERHGYYADFGSPRALAAVLTRVFWHAGTYSAFRGRVWGAPVPPGTDGHRFVVFASDHDQVGNRALGDRPSARLSDGQLAAAAALVLTSPFTPMLFMGEEWGARTPWQYFTDFPDPELGEAVRRGRREEFGGHGWEELYGAGPLEVPDPQAAATFAASRLDWSELGAADDGAGPRAELLAWYRTLIRLRREVADLASGELAATRVRFGPTPDEAAWLVVERGDARVVIDLSGRGARVAVDEPGGAPSGARAPELVIVAAFGPSGEGPRVGDRVGSAAGSALGSARLDVPAHGTVVLAPA